MHLILILYNAWNLSNTATCGIVLLDLYREVDYRGDCNVLVYYLGPRRLATSEVAAYTMTILDGFHWMNHISWKVHAINVYAEIC